MLRRGGSALPGWGGEQRTAPGIVRVMATDIVRVMATDIAIGYRARCT